MSLLNRCYWCGCAAKETKKEFAETVRTYTCGTTAKIGLKGPSVYEKKCK
jgi:hypothetical protein